MWNVFLDVKQKQRTGSLSTQGTTNGRDTLPAWAQCVRHKTTCFSFWRPRYVFGILPIFSLSRMRFSTTIHSENDLLIVVSTSYQRFTAGSMSISVENAIKNIRHQVKNSIFPCALSLSLSLVCVASHVHVSVFLRNHLKCLSSCFH